jgi:hypothetical protein
MVSVLAQEALEANRAQVVLAESFDVLVSVDFALGEILISVGDNLLLLWLHLLTTAKLQIHFIVGIVCHMRGRNILGVSLDSNSGSPIDATNRWSAATSTAPGSSTCTTSSRTTCILRAVSDSTSDLIIVVTLHIF